MGSPAFFKLPLNLPHAGTLAIRLDYHLRGVRFPAVDQLIMLLAPFRESGENPTPEEGRKVAEEAARLGRELVGEIERAGVGHDRLGQTVRNLFECLELGEEGLELSLRAGENPDSTLRPR